MLAEQWGTSIIVTHYDFIDELAQAEFKLIDEIVRLAGGGARSPSADYKLSYFLLDDDKPESECNEDSGDPHPLVLYSGTDTTTPERQQIAVISTLSRLAWVNPKSWRTRREFMENRLTVLRYLERTEVGRKQYGKSFLEQQIREAVLELSRNV